MVHVGLEILLKEPAILDNAAKIGLLCHPASVDRTLVHASKRFFELCGTRLSALLGPEHGLRGEAQDMEAVGRHVDRLTGLEVVSLYGFDERSLTPAREVINDLDILVADLQDVGARYYTYVWTLIRCLKVAGETDTKVVLCDRPNPIGGLRIEGPGVEPGYESFVGGYDIAVRHGMTIGELCKMVVSECGMDVDLSVVKMKGWRREMLFEDTGLPWVLPSPNMPTRDTALVYPGGCLVEATQLSEGRGTTRPFEIMGAGFIDPDRLAETLNNMKLPGVLFRATYFQPTFQKLEGVLCGGIQQHVIDTGSYMPLMTGVAFLSAVRKLWPGEFQWRDKPYEFVSEIPAIDLLSGSSFLRDMLEQNRSLADICGSWSDYEGEFAKRREPFLLY